MPVSTEEVNHVARLAHIGLRPDEVEDLARQLSAVIDHVSRLQQLDTSRTEPTAHVVPMSNVMREDVVQPPWSPAGVIANAPRRQDDFFEVQAVLD